MLPSVKDVATEINSHRLQESVVLAIEAMLDHLVQPVSRVRLGEPGMRTNNSSGPRKRLRADRMKLYGARVHVKKGYETRGHP